MRKIENPLSLTPLEINYRCEGLKESQVEILSHLMHGKSDSEIADMMGISAALVRLRLAGACDRIGVSRRAQLLVMYALWEFSKLRISKNSPEWELDYDKTTGL